MELSPSGEGTRLRYVLEADALDNAAYPITIDPIVLDRLTSEGVELVNLRPPLSEGDSGQVDEEYLKIGGTGTQEHIALMRFNQLAVLGSGDQVTRARLRLRTYDFAESAIICAHKVNGNWEKASVGWNTLMEAGKVDDAVLDYAKGVSSGPVYFDLSNLYREWYESDGNGASKNYGVVLRRGHEADMASGIQQFYKTGSGQDYMPTLIVSYMSHSGVEGYWSYESQSAGRAGTMSVDLFGRQHDPGTPGYGDDGHAQSGKRESLLQQLPGRHHSAERIGAGGSAGAERGSAHGLQPGRLPVRLGLEAQRTTIHL